MIRNAPNAPLECTKTPFNAHIRAQEFIYFQLPAIAYFKQKQGAWGCGNNGHRKSRMRAAARTIFSASQAGVFELF
jgi:hypothetical protein